MRRFIAPVLLLCAGTLFAQQAVIRDLAGTVEIKRSPSAAWENARKGQTLDTDTMISTGFRSTAVIVLGNSLLTVRPLTRLTLAELSRSQNGENVELRLQTGRVRAEVKAQEGGKIDFTVRSSAATASVRGTVFEFDTLNLLVSEGAVEFTGARGESVLVDSGNGSSVDEPSGRITRPEEAILVELKPDLPTAPVVPSETADIQKNGTIGIQVSF